MNKLQQLLSDEFVSELGFYSTAAGLYRGLAKNPVVKELTDAIRTGEISANNIREFVAQLAPAFERGIRFPHENCLAAICVSIEHFANPFSEEFLIDLARVNITELPFAPKVAGICLANLFQTPKTYDSMVACRFSVATEPQAHTFEIDFVSTAQFQSEHHITAVDAECAV